MRGGLLLLAGLVVAIDQASKAWMSRALVDGGAIPVAPGLAWELTHNTGAAFGTLAGGNLLLIGASVLAVAFILLQARRGGSPPAATLAYGLLLGGAVGNLLDRVRLGHVIDFIALQWGGRTVFPNFNVADSAITVGACLLGWTWLRGAPLSK